MCVNELTILGFNVELIKSIITRYEDDDRFNIHDMVTFDDKVIVTVENKWTPITTRDENGEYVKMIENLLCCSFQIRNRFYELSSSLYGMDILSKDHAINAVVESQTIADLMLLNDDRSTYGELGEELDTLLHKILNAKVSKELNAIKNNTIENLNTHRVKIPNAKEKPFDNLSPKTWKKSAPDDEDKPFDSLPLKEEKKNPECYGEGTSK